MDHRWRRNHDPQTFPVPPNEPAAALRDWRVWQAQIAQLSQRLAAQEARHSQQILQLQQSSQSILQKQTAQLQQRVLELEGQLAAANEKTTQDESLLTNLQAWRKKCAQQAQALEAAEQHHSQLCAAKDLLKHWRRAHQVAVDSDDWLQRQRQVDRDRYQTLATRYEDHREKARQRAADWQRQITLLEATVSMLRVDHEAVEVTCADLDHYANRLAAECDDMRTALRDGSQSEQQLRESLEKAAKTQRQQQIEIDDLTAQLAELSTVSEGFDAQLFAKDQELDKTRRLVAESQRQIEVARREAAASDNQNETLRSQVRESASNIADLQEALEYTQGQLNDALDKKHSFENQLRELQTAARAAEANSLLQAGEAQQAYTAELEELREEIAQLTAQLTESSRDQGALQDTVTALTEERDRARKAAQQSSSENDQLQQIVDELNDRLGEEKQLAYQAISRAESLQGEQASLAGQLQQEQAEADKRRHELGELRSQLSQYANTVATLQHQLTEQHAAASDRSKSEKLPTNSQFDQLRSQMQHKINELERTNVSLRERHYQAQVAQNQQLETLRRSSRELIGERDQLQQAFNDASQRVEDLESQLSSYLAHKNPVEEVKRLTQTLSQHIATSSRERERLQRRIDQLHQGATTKRAA